MPRTTKAAKKTFEQLYGESNQEERSAIVILMLARSQRTKAGQLQLNGTKRKIRTVSTATKAGQADCNKNTK